MNYQLSTSMNEVILELVIKGDLTKNDIDHLHVEALEVLREKDFKALLCDIREAKGPLDISDAYYRVRNIPLETVKVPAAIVFEIKLVNKEYQSFYETTAANVGQSLRWFADIGDAREWLKSKIHEQQNE